MRISLLGGVRVDCDDGRPVDVGPPKCQTLLAALALTPGSAIPVSRLVDLVWGQTAPRTAAKTLQTYVGRLRATLGAELVLREGAAYRLAVDAEDVDVGRFRTRLAAGDVAAALAEWTGTPLAGLRAQGLTPTIEALVEEWLGALEADLAAQVDADPAAVIGTLTQLVEQHPYREGLWALLMTGLYRAGRQADALAAYRDVRARLELHLGVDPSPRLQAIERSILTHDDALLVAPETTPPRSSVAAADLPATDVTGTDVTATAISAPAAPALPHRPGALLGRAADLAVVAEIIGQAPVVTLVGPGGIGKTRLALAVAEGDLAPDGPWLVELAEIEDGDDVPRAVADVLGVRETPARSLTETVVAALRSRQGLLLLDNCEHVIGATAELAQAIVEGCAQARVLATSREGLGVEGERLVTVGPLDPAGAGSELFCQRAQAADQAFSPDADAATIVEICRHLDGIPLSIELAASRVRTLSCAELLAGLDDHLRLLTGGRRTAAPRHRTLQATVRWSYDMLSGAEQRLLNRLSTFAGPFDLHAVTQVAVDAEVGSAELTELVGGLVDKSMLAVAGGRGRRRFRMLETIRQFAAARLVEVGGQNMVAQRHSRWCLEEVTRIHALLVGHGEHEGVAELREIWPEIRSAVGRAQAGGDVRQGFALIRPIVGEVLLRSLHEIGDWVEDLLGITPVDDADLRVLGVAWAAQRYASAEDPAAFERLLARVDPPDDVLVRHARAYVHDDYPQLVGLAPQAVAEWRHRGAHHMAELTEPDLGVALLTLGRLDEHDAHVAMLVERYRRHGPPTLLNWALMLMGYSARFRGERDRADRLFDQAVAVQVPDRTYSPNRTIEARSAFRRGEHQVAFGILRAHVAELLETETLQATSIAALEFINMMTTIGRLEDAAWALDYLESSNLLAADGFRSMVSEAAEMIAAAHPPPGDDSGVWQGGDRLALVRMRDVLTGLVQERRAES